MKVKASLHLHSHEDSEDNKVINYSLFELINRAAALGFKVLASTCHLHNQCTEEHIAYAEQRGILLITGVEINIERGHVLVLNGGVEAEKITSFNKLREFKNQHPEALVIAPHPNHHYTSISLARLEKYRDIFDAAEHSWFYTRLIDPNRQTQKLCDKFGLPFVATADLHTLEHLSTDYTILEVLELTPGAVFEAIRSNRLENVTGPKSLWELWHFVFKILILNYFKKIFDL